METQTASKTSFRENFEKFHDKHYKHLLLIPAIILLLSFGYIYIFYSANGDFISKDISLTGGTSVTVYNSVDINQLTDDLSGKLDEINTREIYDLLTKEKIAVIIETKTSGDDTKKILEEYLGYKLTDENSSFEFSGALLSESFYKQLIIAIFFAFIFMSVTVFIIFRKIVPSVAIIISAFADIVMTLAVVDFLGMKISSAGIVAFLMLIGYSVDTDILLTNRVLKNHEGSLNARLYRAFKTGMTMTLTSIVVVLVSLIVSNSFSVVLSQIFAVISIGLFFDMLNTWVTNVSLLKWYARKNEN
ncbi:MAG TPA: protein translocase subunit SecF [Candidatus Nanoarchaeia archaeon]|nr:protein translocase subunit SecF [Candidatus Nanoarchaeia archaeon]